MPRLRPNRRVLTSLKISAVPPDAVSGPSFQDLQGRLQLNVQIASNLAREGDHDGARKIASCSRILSRLDPTGDFRPTWYCRRKACAICRSRIEHSIGEDLVNHLPTNRGLQVAKILVGIRDPLDRDKTIDWLQRLDEFRRGLKKWLYRLNLGTTEDTYRYRWRPRFAKYGLCHSYIAGLHVQYTHTSCGAFRGYRPHMHLTLVLDRDAAIRHFVDPICNWFGDRFCGGLPDMNWKRAGRLVPADSIAASCQDAEESSRHRVCTVKDLQNAAAYACRVHKTDTESLEFFDREQLYKEAGISTAYARGVVALDAEPTRITPARNRLAHGFDPLALRHRDLLLVGCGTKTQRVPHVCDPENYQQASLAVEALADRITRV